MMVVVPVMTAMVLLCIRWNHAGEQRDRGNGSKQETAQLNVHGRTPLSPALDANLGFGVVCHRKIRAPGSSYLTTPAWSIGQYTNAALP